jgi:hypothetical protein
MITNVSLYELLLQNIEKSNYPLIISIEEINYIRSIFLHYPETGYKINKILDDIVTDGKLDLQDIPNIVLLVTEIYKSHIIENEIQHVTILNLVQFTMNTLLNSGLLPLPNMEIEIIKKLADLSITLLKTDIKYKPFEKEYCCFLHF